VESARAATDDQKVPAVTPAANRPGPAAPFYVDPDSDAAQAAAGEPDPARKAAFERLAATPTAFSVGDWLEPDVTGAVRRVTDGAAAAHATAVLFVYNLPHRDAGGGYSAGGAKTAEEYRRFTDAVAAAIGATPTVVVLEPDSLGQMNALSTKQQTERYQLLNEAVDAYGALANTWVYLDGATCGWTPSALMAQRLVRAGVGRARGFAVNVANYQPTAAEIARGVEIAAAPGGAHFVVDTSRTANGPYLEPLTDAWCNPPGRAVGPSPTTDTGVPEADAFLWIKEPGSSDGTCGRGNPPAGTWWPDQAYELVAAASG
jgi:endoglucanase